MSIASEITRLQGVKSDILQAISDKGVVVPVGSALDDCPGLISSISGGDWEEMNYIDGNQNDLFFIIPGEISNYSQAGISETLISLTEITAGGHWCSATFNYKQKLDQYSKIKGAFFYINNSYTAKRFDFDVDITNVSGEKYISFVYYTDTFLNRVRLYISSDKFFDVINGNYYNLTQNNLSGIGANARIMIKELYFE